MKYGEFVELVRRMRKAQTEYFKTKDKGWLNESKKAERLVDAAIEQLKHEWENPTLL